MVEGAQINETVGATAAAEVFEEDTVVVGRSVQTRLTCDESAVEPNTTAERLRGRLDEVTGANVASVKRVTGPQVGGRGITTQVSCETLRVAKHARTEIEEGWPRG